MRRKSYFVGRTKVFTDLAGNPCAFERDGLAVECVCDRGIRCAYHVRQGRRISRRVRAAR